MKKRLIGVVAVVLMAGSLTATGDGARFGPRVAVGSGAAADSRPVAAAPTYSATSVAAAPRVPQWVSLPLFGGEVTSVAADPSNALVVYVGTRDAGVFKSTDGGSHWTPARSGLTFAPIRSLLVDPMHPSTVWAGTDFDWVWKSINGGVSWLRAGTTSTATSMIVFNLAIDPRNTSIVYAGCAGGVALSIGGVWKTADGGATWARADTGIPRYGTGSTYTNGIVAFALDTAHPDTLLAGSIYDGVFQSNDGGTNWSPLNEGVPFMPGSTDYRDRVNALAFDPHHASRPAAVIGSHFFTLGSGAWTQRSGEWDLVASMDGVLAFHPTVADVVFTASILGFAKSGDGGATWASPKGSDGIGRVAISAAAPGTIFGALGGGFDSLGGVAVSSDAGEHWASSSTGLTAADVFSVAADPVNPLNLYVGTGSGFFFASRDAGLTWSAARDAAYTYQDVFNFGEVSSIAVDPGNPSLVSVAAFTGFYRSHDRGASFTKITAVGSPVSIAVSAATAPPTYYVGCGLGDGVYRSTDGGTSWAAVTTGLPTFGGNLNPVLTVATDPNDVRTVWIGTQYGGGILRSSDSGDHWVSSGLTDENFVEAISVRPGNSREILAGAGFWSGKIFKSVDGGATWQTKVSEIGFVKQFLRDPADPDVVYAASEGYGVLVSSDAGETWQDATGEIFYPLVYSLALTGETPPRLLAGSFGSGLYAAPLPREVHRVRRHLHR